MYKFNSREYVDSSLLLKSNVQNEFLFVMK